MAKLKPVVQSLYPTYPSLDHCLEYLSTQLPINHSNELKAALMAYHNTLIKELDPTVNGQATVDELAKARYPDKTFDTALPLNWAKRMRERGFEPVGHFVAMYPEPGDHLLGFYMAPITPQGTEMAARVASMEA